MRFLFDINLLIALMDRAHLHHELAHQWFESEGSRAWATCPSIQNGVTRILGHHSYPNSPGPPSIAASLLEAMVSLPGHEFWADSISVLDTRRFHRRRLLSAAQVTDLYLVALAAEHGGKLVTFDRRIAVDAVVGGPNAILVL